MPVSISPVGVTKLWKKWSSNFSSELTTLRCAHSCVPFAPCFGLASKSGYGSSSLSVVAATSNGSAGIFHTCDALTLSPTNVSRNLASRNGSIDQYVRLNTPSCGDWYENE